MRAFAALLAAEIRSARNRWRFAGRSARRFRRALFLIGAAVLTLIYFASYRIFDHLLHHLDLAPELGVPLTMRLIEMIHLLFFVMLFISSLTVSLSVLYIDPEVAFLGTTPLRRSALMFERTIMIIIRSSWFVVFAASAMLLAFARVDSPHAWLLEFVSSMALHGLFLVAPCCLGMAGTLLLVRYIPARRAKSALLVLSLVSLCAIVIGFRLLMPERFLNPKVAPDFAVVLTMIAEPAAPWLPSGWVASGIVARDSTSFLRILALAVFSLVPAQVMARLLHPSGMARYLSERSGAVGRGAAQNADRIASLAPSVLRPVIVKDILVFWRDPTQWSQLIVLLALVVLYAFNFSQIRGQIDRLLLRDMISFVNLAMAGFILIAVANRFVFSALSLEGRAIWLVRTSPFRMREIMRAKAATTFPPLLLLTESTTYLANRVLEVSPAFQLVSALVVLLMTIAVTSMGIGFGALAPRFDLKDPAQIGMTQHGVLFMGTAMAYVLVFVAILATQLAIALRYRYLLVDSSPWPVFLAAGLAIVLNGSATILPWRLGGAALDRIETP